LFLSLDSLKILGEIKCSWFKVKVLSLAFSSYVKDHTYLRFLKSVFVSQEIFHLIVSVFRGLNDINSPSFARRVNILETVAKVRSCVVMLDLECDELILEMFHTFFDTARYLIFWPNTPCTVVNRCGFFPSFVVCDYYGFPTMLTTIAYCDFTNMSKWNVDCGPAVMSILKMYSWQWGVS
jgi:hypothetical protein